jgi:chaperone required for assembly of F1-ATPase
LRTPGKAALCLPTSALAEAVAAEWAGQGAEIVPAAMPLTRLANVSIDRTPHTRDALIGQVRAYGETDLLCYRAARPHGLVARQSQLWDPPLAWARNALGADLVVTDSALAVAQDEASLAALEGVAAAADDFALTAMAHGAGLTGSAVLALGLAMGALDAETAHTCAFLEEAWQIDVWGADEEAVRRGDLLRAEIAALALWMRALTIR